jgi:hypothetical protein
MIGLQSLAHFSAMPGGGASPKPLKLEMPTIYAGSGNQIDLSIPASKKQREQAMVRKFICIFPCHF